MPKGRFEEPPITEVVCGVDFDQVDEIDPVLVGRFWSGQAAEFPRKQIVPALVRPVGDGLVIDFSPLPPLRTWLISEDDALVMQVQRDRFYLNWRARKSAYPSFKTIDGREGLQARVLRAYESFELFVEQTLEKKLAPHTVEMSMIDLLTKKRHWSDSEDLEALLPMLRPITGAGELPQALNLAVERPRPSGSLVINLKWVTVRGTGEPAIKVETTRRLPFTRSEDLGSTLLAAHADLKDVFDELIPESQHHRFSRDWRPQP